MLNRRSTDPPDGEAPNSLRERLLAYLPSSERALRLWTGGFMWASLTTAILWVSMIPEVAPDHVQFWRLALGGPALIFVLLHIPAGIFLNNRQSYLATVVGAYLGTAVFAILLQITPATWGLLVALTVPGIFIGYFLRPKQLFPLMVFITAVALSSLTSPFADQTPHLGSRLAAYLVALWAVVLALNLQKKLLLRAQAEVERKMYTDPLTGLANHRELRRRAQPMLRRSGREPYSDVALMVIDLDNFKEANTRYGHLGGDITLRSVSDQIRRVLPRDAVAARIGGDEFAILTIAKSEGQLRELAGLLRAAVRASRPELPLGDFEIDACVGYAVAPRDGETLEQLITAADAAMYEEKAARKLNSPAAASGKGAVDTKEAAAATIEWQSRETEDDGPARPSFLGGAMLASRTDIALYTFLGFLVGSAALAVGFLVAGDDGAYSRYAALTLMVGPLFAIGVLIWNPPNRPLPHTIVDLFTIGSLLVIGAMTGGTASPASPLIFLLIIHQAWFWREKAAPWRLITLSVVIFAPVLYDGFTSETAFGPSVAAFQSMLGVALLLAISLFLNQYSTLLASRRAQLLAHTDPLTGVLNRRAFNEFVEDQLCASSRTEKFAIVMIDLDNFKDVNTAHGHREGDELLIAIAESLNRAARDNDCVARVGGDEFAAVLPGAGVDGARALAERFVEAVERCVEGQENAESAGVTASAGFALYPLHGESLDELIRTADDALMEVKSSAKGTARVGRVVSSVL